MISPAYGLSQALPFSSLKACGRLPAYVWRRIDREIERAVKSVAAALMRAFCENLKRQFVVGPKIGSDMSREGVVERVLASLHPHPDCGKPRLWSLGIKDHAVGSLPWPLPKAGEITADVVAPIAVADGDAKVVAIGARR